MFGKHLFAAIFVVLLAGCVSTQARTAGDAKTASASADDNAIDAAMAAVDGSVLRALLAGEQRDPKNALRDQHRHPYETLMFFGIGSEQRVVEITPGGAGWYAEILAPFLRQNGQYSAAMVDPMAAAEGRSRDYQQKALNDLRARLDKHPQQFDRVRYQLFDPKQPVFAEPGSVDRVLTFRNVHNWVSAGTAEAYFKAFYAALKPGGTLGVVDHRAKPGTDLETMKKSGYLTEELVIQLASAAGFVLDARSEINANHKDTADHKNGVWTLPPTNRHDPEDAAMYQAIGESDRMTLRFRKPART